MRILDRLFRRGSSEAHVPKGVSEELWFRLHDPDADVQREALDILVRTQWVEPLLNAFASGDKDVLEVSTWLLCKRPDESLPHLIRALADPRDAVSWGAVHTITRIGPSAIPHLMSAMRDPNKDIVNGAMRCLKEIGKPAVPALIGKLSSQYRRRVRTGSRGTVRDQLSRVAGTEAVACG